MTDIFSEFGLAVGLIIVVLISGVLSVRWVAKLLFSDVEDRDGIPKGYVSRLVKSHCGTMEAVEKSTDENTRCLRQFTISLQNNDQDHKRIADAAHHAVTSLPILGRSLPAEDQRELRNIQLRAQSLLAGVTGYTDHSHGKSKTRARDDTDKTQRHA